MCSRENCRHVEIGDLIVEHGTDFFQDQRWYGIVVGPVKDKKFSRARRNRLDHR